MQMLNLEADGLQQLRPNLGGDPVSYELKTEAAICMDKLDNRRLEKMSWSDESQLQLQHLDCRDRIW